MYRKPEGTYITVYTSHIHMLAVNLWQCHWQHYTWNRFTTVTINKRWHHYQRGTWHKTPASCIHTHISV